MIGEAVKRLSAATRAAEAEIPWAQIAGMRDKLIHDYLGVNLGLVWQVVESELPRLEAAARRLRGTGS